MDDINSEKQISKNPWELRKEIGFLKALIETIKILLTKPQDFFQALNVTSSIKEPYLFYLTVMFFVTVTSFGINKLSSQKNFDEAGIAGIIIMILWWAAGIFLYAAIMNSFVRLFKGQGDFNETFYVLAYGSTAAIFSIIPQIGGWISMLGQAIIVIIGFKYRHKMTLVKASLAALLFPAILASLSLFITFQTHEQEKLQEEVRSFSEYLHKATEKLEQK